MTNQVKGGRVAALDMLRGLAVAAMLMVNNAGDWSHVSPWLEHAVWHGCQPADLIFPCCLVLTGIGLGLSVVSRKLRYVPAYCRPQSGAACD